MIDDNFCNVTLVYLLLFVPEMYLRPLVERLITT